MKAKRMILTAISLGAILLMIPRPALAHHGGAAYDNDKLTTVKGMVTKFEFVNPHVLISMDAVGDNGAVEHWVAETNSNNVLSRRGWTKNTVQVGEQITLVGHRAKNGTNTLSLRSVLDAQGKPVVPDEE